jgi:hypothetical protein
VRKRTLHSEPNDYSYPPNRNNRPIYSHGYWKWTLFHDDAFDDTIACDTTFKALVIQGDAFGILPRCFRSRGRTVGQDHILAGAMPMAQEGKVPARPDDPGEIEKNKRRGRQSAAFSTGVKLDGVVVA